MHSRIRGAARIAAKISTRPHRAVENLRWAPLEESVQNHNLSDR
jgi:hypothetical protein